MGRRSIGALAVALACVLLDLARPAITWAETDVEKADRLFKAGRDHLKAGRYAQACDAFEESQRLDPQLGVLFNLAGCREKTGKLATALDLYRELARTDTNEERRKASEASAVSLAARVPKLVVKVEAASGLAISIDGKDTTPMRGIGVPVDLGKHVVVVRAAGFQDWKREVMVREEKKSIEVPVTLAPVGTQQQALPILDEQKSQSGSPATTTTSNRVKYGKLTTIAGGGLTVIGLGFGAVAWSKWGDAKQLHGEGGTEAEVSDKIQSARLFGNISTVTVIVGLAAAGAGIYLWRTGSSETAVVPSATERGGSVTLIGTF